MLTILDNVYFVESVIVRIRGKFNRMWKTFLKLETWRSYFDSSEPIRSVPIVYNKAVSVILFSIPVDVVKIAVLIFHLLFHSKLWVQLTLMKSTQNKSPNLTSKINEASHRRSSVANLFDKHFLNKTGKLAYARNIRGVTTLSTELSEFSSLCRANNYKSCIDKGTIPNLFPRETDENNWCILQSGWLFDLHLAWFIWTFYQ